MPLPETQSLTVGDGRELRYCVYGPAGGFPVIANGGTPSSRWKWPWLISVMEGSGLRFLVYDRPGYGGSTRHPGRRVVDAAADVAALADARGWGRFAVFGGSGGGPHALACAASMPERVTRCAVLSGVRPRVPHVPGGLSAAGAAGAAASPGSTGVSGAAGLVDSAVVDELRARLGETAAGIMAAVGAGGPEVPSSPPGPPARDDPDAMARLRATFVESVDGWVDDSLAFGRGWGFDPAAIGVPVGLWWGTTDSSVPGTDSAWLLERIPTATGSEYEGGHLPGAEVYRKVYAWLGG